MTGSAIVTTVPSMNAMAEARIVAASTHGRAASRQGTAPGYACSAIRLPPQSAGMTPSPRR